MAPRAAGPRLLLPLLLVAAGVVAALLVAGLSGADGGWISSWWRRSSDQAAGEDLTAKAAHEVERSEGPTLRAADAAKPRETHGPVTVTVKDLQGAPVEGMRVLAFVTEPPKEDGSVTTSETACLTDASGRTRFDDLPYDGRATMRARRRVFAFEPALVVDSNSAPHAEAVQGLVLLTDGQQHQYRALQALQVEMDAATYDGWDALATAVVHGPEVALTVDRGLPLKLEVREGGEGRLRPDARWQVRPRLVWADDAYGATTLPLRRGEAADVTCRVEAPHGFIARKEAGWSTTIHPLAQRLVATYPVRPAVEVILLVPPEGMPYRAEDWEGSITVAGVTLENPGLHVDAQGRLHVRGGAHIVGDRVEVSGTLAKRFQARGEGFIGADPRDPVRVPLTLVEIAPSEAAMESILEFHLNTGVRVRLLHQYGVLSHAVFPLGESDGVGSGSPTLHAGVAPPPEPLPPAPLNVRAVAWHGGPAAGALVRLGGQEMIADAQGRATFPDVGDGQASVQMLGAGASTTLAIQVGPGARPEVELVAQVGGTLEIEVVDSAGRPLPYAHVDLTQSGDIPYMDCVDGAQRLDPYTDAAGRRTFGFVAPGTVKVRAHFGTRSAEMSDLLLVDGATEVVRLVLPVLQAPPPPEPPMPDETGR